MPLATITFALPKSQSFTKCDLETRMFSGLRSLCTMPGESSLTLGVQVCESLQNLEHIQLRLKLHEKTLSLYFFLKKVFEALVYELHYDVLH